MSFLYVFGKERRRDELDNKIIDEVVVSTFVTSSLYPSGNNPLSRVHELASRWYKYAKERHGLINPRKSYIWKNNRWKKNDKDRR